MTYMAFVCLFSLPQVAVTPGTPERETLALMDRYFEQIRDQSSHMELRIEDGGGLERAYSMQWLIRGQASLMVLANPADVRGMRILSVARHQTYVASPLSFRMRRFAGRANAPLFGSAFTYEDFLHVPMAPFFDATQLPLNDTEARLQATAKPGARVLHSRIEIDFRPATLWVFAIRYYDAAGRLVREETREDPVCDRDVCLPGTRRMVDHRRGDLVSEVRLTDLHVNAGLDARTFSVNGMKPFF